MSARSRRAALTGPLGVASLILVAAFVVLAVVAPLLWGERADLVDPEAMNQGPGPDHPLGTDNLGRDILARALVATRLSLTMALVATFAGAVAGTALGVLPAAFGPRTRRWFAAVIDVWLAFPVLLLAMFVSIMLGTGTTASVIALALTMVPSFARLAQTLSASVGGSEYLAAAKVLGIPRRRQLLRYVLPNIAEPLILNTTISIGGGLLALSSLSFLGIGVKAPDYDWGRMLGEGLGAIYTTPTAALAPAVMIVLAGVAFSMLGETLAKAVRGDARHTGPRRAERKRPAPLATTERDDDVLLDVAGLRVTFPGGATPVREVTFQVRPGEIVGIVGESGSGKSVTALAVAGLLPSSAVVQADRITFDSHDLRGRTEAELRGLLGTRMGFVPQDPMTSLNPALRVGRQLAEVVEHHNGTPKAPAWRLAVERLAGVRIADPERRAGQFPHEYSGGMRQRALIAMAQMERPKLIIADEPTTALDVTVQRHVLRLIAEASREHGTAAVVVSHDIALLAGLCTRLLVMYCGRIVEEIDVASLREAAHPYTRALLGALPDLDTDRSLPLTTIPGRPPTPAEFGAGCAFAPRCGLAGPECEHDDPPLLTLGEGRRLACPRVREETTVHGSA
ncbi:oligopeptide/dipeptide ABC transporter ATP-binding protein [Streptosporangium becharense]|uniref:Oligopeptide/dipeptide ABC transporter ATP-binding protein n=1 Tax=Streptosporangium becharense TaxID=1816182 RepID=A0A7W9MK87_9ACTN|nr:dipeptide/oligopeptide/nickel ABC transporter permease/ATP-binding protein [Streptosporangium becharense]MBB2910501.1 oligopeptide/dipeptide ABC transporter ATP-binding protein [Streptosporangium becharense]MBB5823244.1 oligopeptide/dipeptide ABC transporter ATP-binding protein [Streptosporangium becharense]